MSKKRVTLKIHPGKVYEFTEKELVDLRRFGLVEKELENETEAKAEEKTEARAPERREGEHTTPNRPAPKDTTKK